MFAKIINQTVEKYPYSIGNLRQENPQVSFPKNPTDALMESFNAYRVFTSPQPEITATQTVSEGTPQFNVADQRWAQTWVVRDKTAEEIAQELAEQAAQVRAERDRLLAECDWVTIKAVDASADGLGIQLPQVWVDYRKALRDIPTQAGFPWTVTWPEKP